jgi:hypothetical protein
MTQMELAKRIGVPINRLNEIVMSNAFAGCRAREPRRTLSLGYPTNANQTSCERASHRLCGPYRQRGVRYPQECSRRSITARPRSL